MAVGRITGPLLASNLLRDGIDIAVETKQLYLNVSTGMVGIQTATPQYTLDVSGTLHATKLVVDTTGTIGLLTISSSASSATISTTNGPLNITPAANQTVFIGTNTTIGGNLHAVGNITADGNIVLGSNQSADTLSLGAEVVSDIIPKTGGTYNIGSKANEWLGGYFQNLIGGNLNVGGAGGNTISPLTPNTNVNITPTGTGVTNVNSNIRVFGGNPLGTSPVVSNVLYVSMDGSDTNDGRAADATRACRTIKGATQSPYYKSGTSIKVAPGHYFENNPIELLPYTSVIGSDLRTTDVEPINKTEDLFHVQSGCYVAQMRLLNGRSGKLPGSYGYKPGNNRGAYATAFPTNGTIDLFHSPYIQNVTNQSGPWLADGTMFVPNLTVQVPEAVGIASYSENTNTITVTLTTGSLYVGQAVNEGQVDSGYFSARSLLLANSSFIAEQVIAYTDQTYGGPFQYNAERCYRDAGLIVDGLALDVLYQGQSQTVFSGLQYWQQSGYVGSVGGEVSTTTAAVQWISSLTQAIILGQAAPFTYQSTVTQVISGNVGNSSDVTAVQQDFSVITNILTTGTTGVTDKIVPNGALTTATHTLNAYSALQANRAFLQAEAIAYVEATKNTSFTYNQAKCYRDTGLIVDALAQDLLFGGTSQSTFAAIQYWNQPGYTGNIGLEVTTTTNAINYISSLAQKVVVGDATGTRYQNTVTQVISGSLGTSAEAATIAADYSLVVSIISGGTAGITDQIVPNSLTSSTNANVVNAYNLLIANIPYLQAEAIAFITSTAPGFNYTATTCKRDVGYITNSVAFDLLYGGNRQAIQSGVYYYGYSATSSAIPGEQAATLNAYNHIASLVQSIVLAQPVSQTYQYTVTQVTSLPAGSANEVAILLTEINTITNIITNGPSVVTAKTPIGQVRSSSTNVNNAAALLEANRTFIQAETIAYTNAQYFIYDQAKCLRDTGLIVDALAFDLLYPTATDSQSTFAGLQYWNQSGYTGQIGRELTTTTNTIYFLSKLAQKIITNDTTGPRYQSTVTQNTSLTAGTSAEAVLVASDFNEIINILNNGTANVTDKIVPNTTASSTASIVHAYNVLNANRTYMQAEAVAYVDSIRGTFAYNQPKCERDTGLIVDALVQDLLFDGLSQTVFAALQYWDQNGYTGSIAGELTTTTNAINYVSSLAQKIILNDTTGARYQSYVTQTTGLPAGTSAEASTVSTEFALITNILTNGKEGVTDLIVPNGIVSSGVTSVQNAYALLQANKGYIEAEAVAYVNATKTSGFTFDASKCSRDVGFMVDSVCFDLLYGGNKQAIQSGVCYYNFSGSTYIPGEMPQVLAAYQHLSDIMTNIIEGVAISSPYQTWVSQTTSGSPGTISEVATVQSAISTLKNIIQNGPSQAPSLTSIGLTKDTNPNVQSAATILHANRAFIQSELTAFINASYNTVTFTYNEEVCKRDTGLIVDAIAQDLYFGGNSQSTFAGIQYWNQTGYVGLVGNEINTTTNAINYVASLAQKIVLNDTTGQRYTTATQITNLSAPGTTTEAATIANEFATIVNIITTGTTGITDKIIPNGFISSSNANVQNAYALLEANKTYLENEAVAFVNATKTAGFVYNATKCARDVGYMVDSVAFDLLWGGNRQAIQSGVYYFSYSGGTTRIPNESVEVLAAYAYLKTLIANIVTATPVTPYQTAVTQVSNLSPAGASEVTAIQASVDIITGIIRNGAVTASAPTSIPLTPSSVATTEAGVALLEANRSFIQAELVAYINKTYNIFTYNEGTCYRDVGYIVDSVAFDLLHGGNRQAVQSGVYYYGFSNTQSAIPGEQTQTIAAYDRIKSIIPSIITGQAISKTPGNPSTQVTNLPTATQLEVTQLQSKVDKITNIINIGPSAAAEANPISLTQSSSANAQKAFNLLLANRSFIANEVIAYANATYGTGFEYDQAKCYRDIGYMIDCVSFDLLRGGNRQAIQAGTLYFGYNSNNTQLINELSQTIQAYNYLQTIVSAVVQSQTLTSFYQSDVPQVLNENAPASAAVAAELVSDIQLMTRIIQDGPSVAPALIPISLTKSSDTNRANAYALLNANRAFIQAEMIAFTNTLPNFIYDHAKCSRDVGIIVENIAFDATFGGNAKAVETGLGYYDGVTSYIQGETTQTVGAINYINTLANYIINNEVAPNLIGSTATQSQVFNPTLTGGSIAATAITNAINTITYIIQNGPSVAPTSYIGSAVSPNYMSAEVLLQLNRTFIQEEVISYVNQSFLDFPYNAPKCERDTGLIVDAVAFDMLYPTATYSQTTFAGIQYWAQSGYRGALATELTTTTNALNYLSSLAQKVILNDTTGVRYQSNISQVTLAGAPASNTEVATIGNEFATIIEIINYNTISGLAVTDGIVPNGVATTAITPNNAYALLQANRQYLQAETVAYVNSIMTPGFTYNVATCFRDAGYMIDSICFDLVHGGNRQAVQSGVYYHSPAGVTNIPNQQTQSVAAFNHIRDVASLLLQGQTVTPTTGNQLLPVTGLTAASSAEVTLLQSIFANLTNIITNGSSVAPEATPISLTESQNINIQRAFAILEANRAFLQAEMIAWVDYTYNSGGFTYNQDLCRRDTGYIVDAISQDVLLGGNKKSIEAGVTYWTGGTDGINVGNQNVVYNEIPQFTAALNYLKTVAQAVVTNTPLQNQFSTANQIINPFYQGGASALAAIDRSCDIILTIVSNGPNAAPEAYSGSSLFVKSFEPIVDNTNFAPTIASLTTNTDGSYTIGLSQNTYGAETGVQLYFGQTSVYPTLDSGVPDEWAQRRLDPLGSMGGSLVDGAVISSRSPVQSFVYDAYTQVNQGGIGIHITNNGYAQLVSVFTIFCGTSVIVENGGICSITNSNANFGDYCLIAKGYGKLEFFGEIYNPPVLPYYPNGTFPNSQIVEVYCPDPANRPHIGLIMEVVAPEGYTNSQGLPGFLAAVPNTSTITTGTVTINGIDNTGIVIGQQVFIRDQYGSYTDIDGTYYVATGTVVSDVGFQSVTLSKPLTSGGGDPNNSTYFTIYVSGNAYYTVLSSTVAPDPVAPGQLFIGPNLSAPGNNQAPQELQALTYLSELLTKIAGNTRVAALQNTATQVINLALGGGANAGDQINTLFNDLTGVITGGVTNHPTIVKAGNVQSGWASASSLILQNKEFVQAEILAYIDSQYFVYDHNTCARDLGYVLLGFGYDAIYQSNYQARKVGNAYQRAVSSYVLDNEATETSDAIAHIASITANLSGVSTDGLAISNITNGANIIQNILANGTSAQPALVIPDAPNTDAGVSSAKTLILDNLNFIKAETIAWINSTYPVFTYDQTLCRRDVGYILDALSADIITGSNYRAIKAGQAYYRGNANKVLTSELTETIAAFNYVAGLVETITEVSASSTATTQVINDIATINNILTNGVTASPTAVYPLPAGIDAGVASASQLLVNNLEFIKAETEGYVFNTFGGFTYNQAKCYRDVGLIVDSVALDLLFATSANSQATFAGLSYWNQGDYVGTIATELTTTTNTINYISGLAQKVILNDTTGVRHQSTVTQVVNLPAATSAQVSTIATDFAVITNILGGAISGYTDTIVPNGLTPSATTAVQNAYAILEANKAYLQAEAIAYIESTKTAGFNYNQVTCYRDIGYMIDSVSFDLLYGGNKQAVQSGIYYYSFDGTTAIPNESTQVANAYGYLRSILPYIIEGNNVPTTYQNTVTQVTNIGVGTSAQASIAQADIDVMTNIITNGPSVVSTKQPISLIRSTDANVINAATILEANRTFIQAEVIAYINSQYPAGFTYDRTKCKRDVGFLTQALIYDITYGGNAMSIDAASQYYNSANNNVSVIPNEQVETAAAINYINTLAQKVIRNQAPTTAYTTATQYININLTLGINAATTIATLTTDMSNIVSNGLGAVPLINDITITSPVYASTAAQAIDNNKLSISSQAISWINENFNIFTYSTSTCARDIGFIVESMLYDLSYGGNWQTIDAGLQYWNGNNSNIPNEITQTASAVEFINSLFPYITTSTQPPSYYQTAVPQYLNGLLVGGANAVPTLNNLTNIIVKIIKSGSSGAPAYIYPTASPLSTDLGNAQTIINNNTSTLISQTLSYIDTKYNGFEYNQALCKRDVGLVVDAIASDLVNGANYQTILAGQGYWSVAGTHHYVTLEDNVADATLFPDKNRINFYQRSYMSASGYLFEYVGAGSNYGALPQVGRADPIQARETVQLNNGKVFFTSTDQNGDFRIGPGLVISQATGVLSGRTFTKSLFANLTPFILAIEGI